MAEKLLTELGEVLPRVVNGAWGQYCLCRSLLAGKFGCLEAQKREETLSVLKKGDGVEVLDRVVAVALKILEMVEKEGDAMNAEEKELLKAADNKAYRQIHQWGYAVERWVVGVGLDKMGPLWDNRSAAGKGEEGAEDVYREVWEGLADYLLLEFGLVEDRGAGFQERLGELQGAVEVEDAGAAGMEEVFSAVGAALLAEGGISDDMWKEAVLECLMDFASDGGGSMLERFGFSAK